MRADLRQGFLGRGFELHIDLLPLHRPSPTINVHVNEGDGGFQLRRRAFQGNRVRRGGTRPQGAAGVRGAVGAHVHPALDLRELVQFDVDVGWVHRAKGNTAVSAVDAFACV